MQVWAAMHEHERYDGGDESVEIEFIDLVPLRFLDWVGLLAFVSLCRAVRDGRLCIALHCMHSPQSLNA